MHVVIDTEKLSIVNDNDETIGIVKIVDRKYEIHFNDLITGAELRQILQYISNYINTVIVK